ncbi:hypothetical protein LDENG_00200290 [Lucifuga dentata]|nr:hypothetical protein LDENG_00200290 [Lucifuga dentata]
MNRSTEGSSAEEENVVEVSDNEEDDVVRVEVEAVEVASLMDEEDNCAEYQLPKHHRCACHLLNQILAVDANKATPNETYKKVSCAAFAKCWALWNKSG